MAVKLLTLARDLQRRRARERHGLFVAEGARTVEELLSSPLAVRGALVGRAENDTQRVAALRAELFRRGIPAEEVNERDFASAASTDSTQGVLAIAAIPPRDLHTLTLPSTATLLLLDGVQDPGNAGALLRTAAALGASAMIALPGTVDLWNAKVVRSAMGALFHQLAVSITWEALDEFRLAHHVALWGAAADGEPMHGVTAPARLALVIGNEGAGLSREALRRVERSVGVPLAPDSESLNVAVAAGILLYHFHP